MQLKIDFTNAVYPYSICNHNPALPFELASGYLAIKRLDTPGRETCAHV